MNWWAVVIIAFAVGMLPWQIFRHIRRGRDARATHVEPKPEKSDESDGFW